MADSYLLYNKKIQHAVQPIALPTIDTQIANKLYVDTHNIFNQGLNTTDSPTFSNITITNDANIGDDLNVIGDVKIGDSVTVADRTLHFQGRKSLTLFLEGDTDNVAEEDVPSVLGTTDGGNVGFNMTVLTTNVVSLDLCDAVANNVNFTIHRTPITNNGIGNLPTIGARVPLITVLRDGSGVNIDTGGLKFPGFTERLAAYEFAALNAAWTGSTGAWAGGNVTGTIERIGNTVTIKLNSKVAALSNGLDTLNSPAGFIPATFRPLNDQVYPSHVLNVATPQTGLFRINASGTMIVYGTEAQVGFTGAGGNAGWNFAVSTTYAI